MNIRAWLMAHVAVFVIAVDASANEDVRRAIAGHEKFVVRCLNDLVGMYMDTLKERTAGMSASEFAQYTLDDIDRKRAICDEYYEGVNVCVEGGAKTALESMQKDIADVQDGLSDPLTRADDYELLLRATERLDMEVVALEALIANPSTYCGVK